MSFCLKSPPQRTETGRRRMHRCPTSVSRVSIPSDPQATPSTPPTPPTPPQHHPHRQIHLAMAAAGRSRLLRVLLLVVALVVAAAVATAPSASTTSAAAARAPPSRPSPRPASTSSSLAAFLRPFVPPATSPKEGRSPSTAATAAGSDTDSGGSSTTPPAQQQQQQGEERRTCRICHQSYVASTNHDAACRCVLRAACCCLCRGMSIRVDRPIVSHTPHTTLPISQLPSRGFSRQRTQQVPRHAERRAECGAGPLLGLLRVGGSAGGRVHALPAPWI